MKVQRINMPRHDGFTIMSNYHLRDSRLSLSARGLMSQMLSLPPGWDFTIAGLSKINREGSYAINSALNELKECGYFVVTKKYPGETESGRIEYEYTLLEKPVDVQPKEEEQAEEQVDKKQDLKNQGLENQTQINTDYKASKNNYREIKKEKEEKEKKEKAAKAASGGSADDEISELMEQMNPETRDAVDEWIEYKRESHRFTYKGRGLKALLTSVADAERKYGSHAVASLIRECMGNGWKGIIFDKLGKSGGAAAKKPFNYDYDDDEPLPF